MQRMQVKDLAVSLSDYATVNEEATFYEAILALYEAREGFDPQRLKHRAILVLDKNGQVVGKIGFHEVLEGLEPKYSRIREQENLGGIFTPAFLKTQLQKYKLWDKPLDDICRKAAYLHVRDFMHTPGEAELIDEAATLDQAVHQLILTRQQSLLIKRGDQVSGILRLSDVVERIFERTKACGLDVSA
jgi:hypothetical protein